MFYEAARDLDSPPSSRADHVEACRPQGCCCSSSLAARVLLCDQLARVRSARRGRPLNENDAVPGRLRNLAPVGPKAFLRWWRGLTPQWPRSLRLGSASGFKVARASRSCKPRATSIPHFPEKSPSQNRRTLCSACSRVYCKPPAPVRRASLGAAYRRCHNGVMDSGYPSLRPPAPAALPGVSPATPPAQPVEDPFGHQPRRESPVRDLRKRIGSALAAAAALIAKFFAAIKGFLLLLPKAQAADHGRNGARLGRRLLLFFGWWFAVGFVVLLFVHEMGHVIQLRREGIKASAPMFIPFLGAVVDARSRSATMRSPRRASDSPARSSARSAPACAWRSPRRHRQRSAARTRLHRLLPQPVQPAAGGARSTAGVRWPRWRRRCGSSASARMVGLCC